MNRQKIIFFLLILFFFLFPVTPPLIFAAGLVFGLFFGNPFPDKSEKYTSILIKFSIILLGFAPAFVDFKNVFNLGFHYAAAFVFFTLFTGFLFFGFLKSSHKSGVLETLGIALGGNEAVKANAPVINADANETNAAFSTILIINSVAIFIFPLVALVLDLTRYEYALWTAIAIPDTLFALETSSIYGADAFLAASVINILKFSILIPATASFYFLYKNAGNPRFPWFLLLFFAVFIFRNNLPLITPPSLFDSFVNLAKSGFAVALFLTGTLFSRDTFNNIRIKPLVFGLIFWFVLALTSLLAIIRWI